MRVLGVGAHPDDLEILAGGTLARLAREGNEVVMCHMTRGNCGHFELSSDELVEIRHREARRAAEIAGARHATLGLDDGTIDASDQAQKQLVVNLIRETRPDFIITHYPDDYMRDHNETSALVWDCSFLAALKLFESGAAYHPVFPPIYYMETIGGLKFNPTEFVDVTDDMETKIAMLSAHESQRGFSRSPQSEQDAEREQDGDLVTNMKAVTRFRGVQCNVDYAEGFLPCLTFSRPVPRRLLP
jgi:N-acetylglucosamine malate deacetylase 1